MFSAGTVDLEEFPAKRGNGHLRFYTGSFVNVNINSVKIRNNFI